MGKISKSIIFLSVFITAVISFALNISLFLGAVLLFLMSFLLSKKVLSVRFFLVLFSVFSFGVFYANYKMPKGSILEDFIYQKATIYGVVDSTPKESEKKLKFHLKAYKIISDKGVLEGQLGNIAVTIYKANGLQIGDNIKVYGKLYKPFYAKNVGQFDYAAYLKNKNIFTTLYTSKYEILGVDESAFYQISRKFNQFRKKIMLAHNQHLGEVKSKLLGGVIFGYRAVNIPKEVKQNFINSGLLHLLSASGLHVGLILGIWYFIARVFRFPFAVSIVSSGVVVLLYSCLTGFPPSIMRAMLMAEFILLGNLVDRKADNIALLLLVCSIMLLFNPMYVLDIGFQLSFIVTFGILFCLPTLLEKFDALPDYLAGAILVPCIAQVWAIPLLIYHFNTMPLYSVIANIIIIPFMAVISFLGFLSSVFALIPFMDWGCFILDKVLQPFLDFMMWVSSYFSSLPVSLVYVAKPILISVFLFYLFIMFFVYFLKQEISCKKLFAGAFLSIAVLILLNLDYDFSRKIDMTFFSVGNADSIFVQLPNKKNFIVDTGRIGFGKYNSGFSVINQYFKNKGIYKLNSMVLTHPDSDHIGGALDVMKFTNPNSVYTVDKKCTTNVCNDLNAYISKNNFKHIYPKTKDRLYLDKDVFVEFIVPDGKNEKTFNDDSIITYIKYKDFSALLMGDNESDVFDLIKNHIRGPIDLLKVGHHGSYRSLNKNMLNYLQPKVAIFCVGKNGFGHPNKRILELLKKHGVKIFRTDKDNMLKVTSLGAGMEIRVFDREEKIMKKIF